MSEIPEPAPVAPPPPTGELAAKPSDEAPPSGSRRDRLDPDQQAQLESEREFLLRSLDDLEAERAAGDIEPDEYERLKDDYTARAAAVLRTIESGVDRRPVAAPTSPRRRLTVGATLLLFAAGAGLALTAALGDRQSGQTASGNAQSGAAEQRAAAFERQVLDNPNDASAHLEYARFLLETEQPARAVKEFDTAAKLDPANAEALAYAGWLVYLAGSQGSDEAIRVQLIDKALERLTAATAAAPDYPDARFFRGMVLFRGKNDAPSAVPEFEKFLALVPEGPEHDRVAEVLALAKNPQPVPGPATQP